MTGANFLLDSPDGKILIDCGLVQGGEQADALNRAPFPYAPNSIDALLITHAHLDHIGRVPKLVHEGFLGPIYSTPVTKELAALMFDDALGIMADEERERGVKPLYSRSDVDRTLMDWQTREYHQTFTIGRDNIGVEFLDTGHVLGSAMVACTHHGRTIVFTGDLGNTPGPLLRDTEQLPTAHYVVMESVYGNRLHEERELRREKLRVAVQNAHKRGGTLLIPAFALHRTQVLLYELHQLFLNGAVAPMPVYVDSPLAEKVTALYEQNIGLLNDDAQQTLGGSGFYFPEVHVVKTMEESARIDSAPNPKIIIAGSGMSHGGRVLAHEARLLTDATATMLFVGYQAAGTLGRRIQEGEKRVKIDGEWVRVRAHVETVHGYSGHADRDMLMHFIASGENRPEEVFVVMGEPRASLFLAQRIHDFLGLRANAPQGGDEVVLEW